MSRWPGLTIRDQLTALLESGQVTDDPTRMCLEIEQALAEPEFEGAPVGSTLTDLLGSLFLWKVEPASGKDLAWLAIKHLVYSLRGVEPPGSTANVPGLQPGRVLIAAISIRPYHRTWLPTLVEAIGADYCNITSYDPVLRQSMPSTTGAFTWRDAPALDITSWRTAYSKCARNWNRTISRIRRGFGFSRTSAAQIRHAMLIGSQRITRYGALLDRLRPAAILVEYDRNSRGACLVLAAQQRGIPTLTLLHGVINGPYGYTPILADRVLCWGSLQRAQLARLGTPEQRIDVVGFERLQFGLSAEKGEVRRKMGITEGNTVAVLATNPIGQKGRERLAVAFCEALVCTPGVQGIVRLHPSESLARYRAVRDAFPQVRFSPHSELSQEEAFALADVVVVHSSGFGGEALAKGALCAVLDVLDYPLGHGADLIKYAGAPAAGSAAELADIVARVRADSVFRGQLRKSAQNYVQIMYTALGEEACRNIAGAVLARANPP